MPSWSKVALLGLLVTAAVVAGPGVSAAQWTFYDDFSSGLVNPDKWFGSIATGGPDNPTAEESRLIRFGLLELMLRQYGRATDPRVQELPKLVDGVAAIPAGAPRLFRARSLVIRCPHPTVPCIPAAQYETLKKTGFPSRRRLTLGTAEKHRLNPLPLLARDVKAFALP